VFSASVPIIVLAFALAAPQAPSAGAPASGPETFDVVATATAGANAKGTLTVPLTVQIDRYTPEHERTKMTDALKYNGYPGFVNALREAPRAGTLDVAGDKFAIRWARSVDTDTGRVVTIVTDQPVGFVGQGRRGSKPTAGYEVAVMQLTFDKTGHGTGTMAAAARVKPGGETGVRIDNYADKPLTLTATVHAR
jgi:hypothetical protein